MTFDQLKKQVGKNIKYYNDTDGWTTGRDVTETDIGQMINQLYREDLFPRLATQYPWYFRQEATANNWIATGTVDATSTGTTLVATTSIFTNSMIGLVVYNETDNISTTITAYTSDTTVTVEDTIGNDWDGDTIFVLGQEFTFGGDATDIYVVEGVGLKYSSADQFYRQVGNVIPKFDYYQVGDEKNTTSDPMAYLTTVKTSTGLKSAIGVIPKFENKLANAIKIDYIAKPPELSDSSDEPRLPVDMVLMYGATGRAYLQKQMFNEANQWLGLYERYKTLAISNWRPTATGTPKIGRLPRWVRAAHDRRI